jgi:hypothetical protein
MTTAVVVHHALIFSWVEAGLYGIC